jgi:mono/diheme cytochrome c family protein
MMVLPCHVWNAGLAFLLASILPALSLDADQPPVDFNREIRPVLSDKCYACHGPNEADREGGFRLDQKESVLGEADSGEHPLVSGDPDASELYRRMTTDDEDMRMPPNDSGKALTPEEIQRVRVWIEQGAPWQEHWAFTAPVRPDLPPVKDQAWPRNEIDRFILARLETAGLKPSAEADKATLLRRVTFDLTGLPPTLQEIDDFLADDSPQAYEQLVDRLLQSPHYGEHMARFWLDAARYGDTHGLHLDNYREMWPYRDWVVRALNDNLPFDQFAIEQLAGDLLPDSTLDQQIATGFNRCHVTTSEGGSIAEEVYVRNVVDRVVTTSAVFMGVTFDCTRCHDHKYDPFTMKDFYALFGFFNSLDGNPLDGNKKDPAPVVRVLTDDQKTEMSSLQQQREDVRAKITVLLADYEYVEPEKPAEPKLSEPTEIVWLDDELPPAAREEGGWNFITDPVYSGKKASTRTATGLSQHFFTGAKPPLRVADGDVLFTYVYLDPKNPPKEIMLQWNDGSWEHRAYWGENAIDWGKADTASRRRIGDLPTAGQWVRLDIPASEVGLNGGAQINGWAFTQFDGTVHWDKAGIVTKADQKPIYDSLLVWHRDQRAAKGGSLPDDVKRIIVLDDGALDDAQQKRLRDYFVEYVYVNTRSDFDPLHKQMDDADKRIAQIENSAATTLVFRETKDPKPSHLLNRGEYDQKRDEVPRATPAAFPPMPEGAPLNRLGLAQWLVDPAHPLTARVAVNRYWQQVCGVGIVKTAEDFGSQGDVPTHPKLLDWLAVDFRESGWDVKRLMKEIVMSATYRQSSAVTPELVASDPNNRLLARGPRFRLDAEMLRDQALAVSELLVDRMGGPSVKPPQPDGLWFAVGYSGSDTVRFKKDEGPDKVHRRTLYTFIKRTSPPPQMSTFDAPSREACSMRRERTNTPLQALLLLNDPQYVEAARGLAARAITQGGDSPQARAAYMFRLCTARQPDPDEAAELVGVFGDHLAHFTANIEAAKRFIEVGELKPDESLDPVELAAWTMVANLILNLDEVVSKN